MVLANCLMTIKCLYKNDANLGDKQKGSETAIQVLTVGCLINILCWLPSGIMLFTTVSSKQYSATLFSYAIVIIMPANSILYPWTMLKVNIKKGLNKDAKRRPI